MGPATPYKTITSAANPAIKKLCSLALKKYREQDGLFLVEGVEHVHAALQKGWEPATVVFSASLLNDQQTQKILTACAAAGGQCLNVAADILSRITKRDNAQPLIAALRQREGTLGAVQDGLWVGLEEIRDPGNLGTIIRSSRAVGARGIILIGETCDPWSPEAIRASTGSFAWIALVRAAPDEFLNWRKMWKGQLIGTHLRAPTDYRRIKYESPLMLLMGGEQTGLSPALSEICDALVKIPMCEGTESLNLAVSTGILLYEACRERL